MQRKEHTDAQLKLMGEGEAPGSIGFYLSTFVNWDRVRPIPERPVKGAFERHIPDFLKDGFITISHDWGKLPIASPTKAFEDHYGLWVEAEFHSTPAAQEARTIVRERIERGKSVKTSMGYDVLSDEFVDMDDPALEAKGIKKGRLLKDIPLYEGSLVNVPANPLADVTSVKSILSAGMPLVDHLCALRDGARSGLSRLADRNELLEKEGRRFSAETLSVLGILPSDLRELADRIDEMIASQQPKANEEEIRKALAGFLVMDARVKEIIYGNA